MVRERVKIKYTKHLGSDIYSLWLISPKITKQAKPGQFVQAQISDSFNPFLCRPISIADVKANQLRMIFRVRGKGTTILKEKAQGDMLYLLGPLGKPIIPVKDKQIILCAGGVGIAPLLFLAKELSKKNKLYLYFGAKNKSELVLRNEFNPLCEKNFLTTEDGSIGHKGFITDLLTQSKKYNPDILYAAGPLAMLKKISNLQFPIPNLTMFGFLEERMGCGCGICFGCAVKKKDSGYLRVCSDGPVIDLAEVIL
jgi:dihydroorotate dehydrogenase electron transfer subunit